jgi:predicted HTH domain antitoxin
MVITISDEVLKAARLDEQGLKRELAVALFERERLTMGQAASLAELSHLEFQQVLADRRIPVHYGPNEFEEDLNTLRDLRRT